LKSFFQPRDANFILWSQNVFLGTSKQLFPFLDIFFVHF
jgi:hypothetical protein